MSNAWIRTTLSARESALMGWSSCGNEAELRGVFRQVHNVSLPTFRVKIDIFHLSKLTSFDAARRIPMLRRRSQGRVRKTIVQHTSLCSFDVGYSMSFICSVCNVSWTNPEGLILARVLGRSLISEKGWGRALCLRDLRGAS